MPKSGRIRPSLRVNTDVKRDVQICTSTEKFASMILQGLYLGTRNHAFDISQLKQNGISRIVNTAKECQADYENFDGAQVMHVGLTDISSDGELLLSQIGQVVQFIDEGIRNGEGVLVHCRRGISRSPAVVMAYLMHKFGWDLDTAFAFVKERRSSVNPQFGFLRALEQYAQTPSVCSSSPETQSSAAPGFGFASTLSTDTEFDAVEDNESPYGCHMRKHSNKRDFFNHSSPVTPDANAMSISSMSSSSTLDSPHAPANNSLCWNSSSEFEDDDGDSSPPSPTSRWHADTRHGFATEFSV